MTTNPIFGIDLGTTYSCISYVDEHGKPVIIHNAEGEMTTPSVVYFESPTSLVVGKVAKEHSDIFPERVVSCVKRSMGTEHWEFACDGQNYMPQEVASFIIRKLMADTKAVLGLDVREAVITCPAYFGPNQKEATRQAGILAGLHVHYIISEPTAAALAYISEQDVDQTVLVYDLGGGTFDVTLMELKNGHVNVLATGGDDKLGGRNWDEVIVEYLISTFCDNTGADEAEIYEDAELYQEIISAAETGKKSLSSQQVYRKALRVGEHKALLELTRETFMELTAPLFLRTVAFTEDLFAEAAARGHKNIDKLLLVGGSTYMPQIFEGIHDHFGSRCSIMQFHPNQAVAEGAALFAHNLAQKHADKGALPRTSDTAIATNNEEDTVQNEKLRFAEQQDKASSPSESALDAPLMQDLSSLITNVSAKGFGVAVMTDKGLRVRNLLFKNTPLPCSAEETFGTWEEGQANVTLQLMENECSSPEAGLLEIDFCTELSSLQLELDTALPAQSPVQVRFAFSADGLLSIEARDLTHGRSLQAKVQTTSLMDEHAIDASIDKHADMALR